MTASSQFGSDQDVRNLINGKGMLHGFHDNNGSAQTMWHNVSKPSPQSPSLDLPPSPAWVKFEFDEPKKLASILVWNLNQSGLTDRGFRETDFYGSSDGVTRFHLTSPETIVLPRANGNRNNREHIKPRLIIGQLLAMLGGVTLGLQLVRPGLWPALLGLGIMGVGMGFMMPAMTAGVLMSSPTHMSGLASGILNSARQTGGVLGVALMGTLVQRQQEHGLLLSFGLASLCFLLMTTATLRHLRYEN
jgi:hypothetical protein